MPAGRPEKYESHVKPRLDEITQWFKDGICEYDMCDSLSISHDAWSDYKKKYSELNEAIKKGQQKQIQGVVNSLIKKANGYEYEETTKEKNSEGDLVVTKKVTKHYVPDTTAQIFYLKNKDPENWKDKVENTLKIESELPDDQLKDKLNELMKEYQNLENK